MKFPTEGLDISSGGKPLDYLQLTHYGYESDFAPPGHTVMTLAINQFAPELDYWQEIYTDKESYGQEKRRIGELVLGALHTRFPEMQGKLTLLDVATPATYTRYCNAYKGAFMAFWPTLTGKELNHSGRIKGLENLWLSGQWLQPPGGLPNALITGKDTIVRICQQEGRQFSR
jgi:phytoene dehydrogenase-like protein